MVSVSVTARKKHLTSYSQDNIYIYRHPTSHPSTTEIPSSVLSLLAQNTWSLVHRSLRLKCPSVGSESKWSNAPWPTGVHGFTWTKACLHLVEIIAWPAIILYNKWQFSYAIQSVSFPSKFQWEYQQIREMTLTVQWNGSKRRNVSGDFTNRTLNCIVCF